MDEDDDDDDDDNNNNNMYTVEHSTNVSSGTVASAGVSGECMYYIHTVGQTKAAQLLPQGLRKRLDRVYMHGVRRKRIAMANFRLQKKGYVVVLASDYNGPTTRVRGTHDAKSRNQ